MEIPTAEHFLIKQGCQRAEPGEQFFDDVQPKDLIEFAKSHVRAALEAAYSESKMKVHSQGGISDYSTLKKSLRKSELKNVLSVEVYKDSILNAYPEENIK